MGTAVASRDHSSHRRTGVHSMACFRRGSRIERGATFLLSTVVTGLFVAALWRWSRNPSTDENRAVLAGLILAPLVVAILFHLKESRLFARRRTAARRLPDPPGRIRVVDDGGECPHSIASETAHPGLTDFHVWLCLRRHRLVDAQRARGGPWRRARDVPDDGPRGSGHRQWARWCLPGPRG